MEGHGRDPRIRDSLEAVRKETSEVMKRRKLGNEGCSVVSRSDDQMEPGELRIRPMASAPRMRPATLDAADMEGWEKSPGERCSCSQKRKCSPLQ